MFRKTKIVCTIGPATQSVDMINRLLIAGMDVARLNFSHGTLSEHSTHLQHLRACANASGRNLGVMLDIQGPKIRVGTIQEGTINLQTGDSIMLTAAPCDGTASRIHVGYPHLDRDVKPGSTVYIDDGLLELRVVDTEGSDVRCEVIVGGPLSSRKGVTFPGVDVDLPPVTDEDVEHIRFGVQHKVDFIAASFVRRGEHVRVVKEIIRKAGGDLPVIAKIESDAGLQNVDEIITEADGLMVARGDLGVEIPPEEVPLAQKMLIEKCNDAGIPVITATQMLDSMMRNPRATRAEITDVANAILDGTDCVMLSGETAVGQYPVKAVELMDAIAMRMEESIDYAKLLEKKRVLGRTTIADAISLSTCQAAQDLTAKAIIVSTQSGATALRVAKYRPGIPILAVCTERDVVKQLSCAWGVYPVLVKKPENIDEMIDVSVQAAKQRRIVKKGDIVTITAGVKTGVPGSTNLLQIYEIE